MSDSSPAPPPLSDSPWFWAHLFCTAALIGLLLIGPKWMERQAGFERKFQARQRASLEKAGEQARGELSAPGRTIVALWPLLLLLTVAWIVSWLQIWRHRRRQRAAAPPQLKELG